MSVLITGVTGLRNRGVEALVTTTIEQIRNLNPDIAINVLTQTPDYDQLKLKDYNHVSIMGYPRSFIHRVQSRASKFYKNLDSDYQLVKNSSLVIASGGDLFTSDYPGALEYYLRKMKLALQVGVPIVFLGQSVSFKTRKEADIFLQVASKSKLITVRENLSYKYLTEELGLSRDLVKHTADSAFLLKPPSQNQISNLLESYGCIRNRPLIAISPSQGISKYAKCSRDAHFGAWRKVIDMILSEIEAQIIIIPHVQDGLNDDRILASDIHKSFNYDPRIHLAGGDHSASEFKGLISACDMLVAERMHAAIAGLSSGVCTVVVGYSVKAEGIVTDLLGTDSLSKDSLISIQDFINGELACNTIQKAWNSREKVADKLREVLPIIKGKAAENFQLLLSAQ